MKENKLRSDILELQGKSKYLEPSESERSEYLKTLDDFSTSFISSLSKEKAYVQGDVSSEHFSINNEELKLDDILSLYKEKVVNYGIKTAGEGHLGYIPGGGIFTSGLGDLIAAVSNVYAGIYYGSPGAVGIENAVIDWMKKVFSYPTSAIGNLTSGGSIANLIGLTAARDHHKIKKDKIERSVIYLSPQTHHCIHKALRIIGLEDIQCRYIQLDDHSKMITADLVQKILDDKEKGLNPFLVIASAGTTDTGAVDPLKEIGQVARSNNLWYHIDGAYGGFFILTENKKHLFEGIEMSDSLVIDPHKGLFLPYGLGTVLIKNRESVFRSNQYRANYMQDAFDDQSPVNPADVSPELTKHFRGLRLWVPLKLHGIKPFIACLEEKILLTQYFRQELLKIGFKLGPEPDLSVSYFWYPAVEEDENTFNKRLMSLLHQDGQVFFSSTNIDKKFVIRMAILSFRTKLSTIDKGIEMIKRNLDKLL